MPASGWEIAEYGKSYLSPDGTWELLSPEEGSPYILRQIAAPSESVEISSEHGLYYALDLAAEYLACRHR